MGSILTIALTLCQFFYPGTSNKRYLQQKACLVYYESCIEQKLKVNPYANIDVVVTQCIMESKN